MIVQGLSQDGSTGKMPEQSAVLDVTARAWNKIRDLVGDTGCVRVDVDKKGCAGLRYEVSKGDSVGKYEEVVERDGLQVLIAAGAIMFLLGSKMDVEEDDFGWRFTFVNPNESGRCGCGLSFYI